MFKVLATRESARQFMDEVLKKTLVIGLQNSVMSSMFSVNFSYRFLMDSIIKALIEVGGIVSTRGLGGKKGVNAQDVLRNVRLTGTYALSFVCDGISANDVDLTILYSDEYRISINHNSRTVMQNIVAKSLADNLVPGDPRIRNASPLRAIVCLTLVGDKLLKVSLSNPPKRVFGEFLRAQAQVKSTEHEFDFSLQRSPMKSGLTPQDSISIGLDGQVYSPVDLGLVRHLLEKKVVFCIDSHVASYALLRFLKILLNYRSLSPDILFQGVRSMDGNLNYIESGLKKFCESSIPKKDRAQFYNALATVVSWGEFKLFMGKEPLRRLRVLVEKELQKATVEGGKSDCRLAPIGLAYPMRQLFDELGEALILVFGGKRLSDLQKRYPYELGQMLNAYIRRWQLGRLDSKDRFFLTQFKTVLGTHHAVEKAVCKVQDIAMIWINQTRRNPNDGREWKALLKGLFSKDELNELDIKAAKHLILTTAPEKWDGLVAQVIQGRFVGSKDDVLDAFQLDHFRPNSPDGDEPAYLGLLDVPNISVAEKFGFLEAMGLLEKAISAIPDRPSKLIIRQIKTDALNRPNGKGSSYWKDLEKGIGRTLLQEEVIAAKGACSKEVEAHLLEYLMMENCMPALKNKKLMGRALHVVVAAGKFAEWLAKSDTYLEAVLASEQLERLNSAEASSIFRGCQKDSRDTANKFLVSMFKRYRQEESRFLGLILQLRTFQNEYCLSLDELASVLSTISIPNPVLAFFVNDKPALWPEEISIEEGLSYADQLSDDPRFKKQFEAHLDLILDRFRKQSVGSDTPDEAVIKRGMLQVTHVQSKPLQKQLYECLKSDLLSQIQQQDVSFVFELIQVFEALSPNMRPDWFGHQLRTELEPECQQKIYDAAREIDAEFKSNVRDEYAVGLICGSIETLMVFCVGILICYWIKSIGLDN